MPSPAAASVKTPIERPLRADARRNRDKVLLAARRRFTEDGLDAQIDDIARDAGVGVGTIYRHFPTKEDLLHALADARFDGLAAAGRAALEIEDPWEGFVQFMTYSAKTMAEDRALSKAMDQLPGLCSSSAQRVDMLEITRAVVDRAREAQVVREDLVAEHIPALVCGLGRAVRSEVERPTLSWERFLEIILAGVRGPKAPAGAQ